MPLALSTPAGGIGGLIRRHRCWCRKLFGRCVAAGIAAGLVRGCFRIPRGAIALLSVFTNRIFRISWPRCPRPQCALCVVTGFFCASSLFTPHPSSRSCRRPPSWHWRRWRPPCWALAACSSVGLELVILSSMALRRSSRFIDVFRIVRGIARRVRFAYGHRRFDPILFTNRPS